jgi:hypothetical protein
MRSKRQNDNKKKKTKKTDTTYLVSRGGKFELQCRWLDSEANLHGSVNGRRARWVEQVAVLMMSKWWQKKKT